MKLKSIAVFAVVLSVHFAFSQTDSTTGQTNSAVEFRVVKNVTYDVSKPPFISVTIPAGTAFENAAAIHFEPSQSSGEPVIVKTATFQIPAIYDPNSTKPVTVIIYDFPYSPLHFKSGTVVKGAERAKTYQNRLDPLYEQGIVTKEPITLRLFPAHPATTNYDALGNMKIIPAKPDFIYGTPAQ